MGRRSNHQPPKMCHHKGTGQAYSNFGGKRVYFGLHGSKEAFAAYQAFLADWYRTHGQKIVPTARKGTLAAAVQAFLADIEPPRYSAVEHADISRDLAAVTKSHGFQHPDQFRLTHLRAIRDQWMSAGNTRSTLTRRVSRIRRFFRWCVNADLCKATTWESLKALLPVTRGQAADPPDIEPVPLRQLAATLRHLPATVAAMARLQYYCGCRPGEICRMRGAEIFKAGKVRIGNRSISVPPGVWLFLPGQFKTLESGRPLIYQLGPRCQRLLTPFLGDDPTAFLFDPQADGRRRQRPRGKPPQPCYVSGSYYRVVERTCDRHGIAHWSPNQLRHNFVSRVQDVTGDLVATSEAVGHQSPDTTLIYLQRRIAAVGKLAARIG